jgi:Zn-dependent M28 family amino/carboxypeptidase
MDRFRLLVLFALSLPLFGQSAPVKEAFADFRAEAIRAHTRFLSSDLLEGRGPGTRGDALTTDYLAANFEALGLEPAGDAGTFFQKVSLLGITTKEEGTTVSLVGDGAAPTPLRYREQFVGGSPSQKENVALDSELVFVGHGVTAPEYRWDDFKGVDMRGKTLVMLVDDPPATTQEPELFRGRARTYYGRWTYKFEQGTAHGAEGVILIHTTPAAGYGWQVVRNSWSGEQAYVRNPEGRHALSFAGWVTEETAADLFKRAGLDLAKLTETAHTREFKPVSLGHRLKGTLQSVIRPFDTANVIARLEGSDPVLKDEAVLYSAHHDHLGIGTPDDDDASDTIYNGAIDNAGGTATVLELARVWSERATRPKRSIYFALVAAEEQGLLGSAYLGEHPPLPAGRIAFGVNLDALNLYGPVDSITLIGADRTTFYPTIQKIAKSMGLTLVPDQAPEQGSYYRSDHFSLAKAGVPAFSIKQGSKVVGKPEGFGEAKSKEYREKHYHQASDEFDPTWDFSSAVQMAQLSFWLGWEAAQATEMPMWLEGEEFYAKTKAVRGSTTREVKTKE